MFWPTITFMLGTTLGYILKKSFIVDYIQEIKLRQFWKHIAERNGICCNEDTQNEWAKWFPDK